MCLFFSDIEINILHDHSGQHVNTIDTDSIWRIDVVHKIMAGMSWNHSIIGDSSGNLSQSVANIFSFNISDTEFR